MGRAQRGEARDAWPATAHHPVTYCSVLAITSYSKQSLLAQSSSFFPGSFALLHTSIAKAMMKEVRAQLASLNFNSPPLIPIQSYCVLPPPLQVHCAVCAILTCSRFDRSIIEDCRPYNQVLAFPFTVCGPSELCYSSFGRMPTTHCLLNPPRYFIFKAVSKDGGRWLSPL